MACTNCLICNPLIKQQHEPLNIYRGKKVLVTCTFELIMLDHLYTFLNPNTHCHIKIILNFIIKDFLSVLVLIITDKMLNDSLCCSYQCNWCDR